MPTPDDPNTRPVVISIWVYMVAEAVQGLVSLAQAANGGGGAGIDSPLDGADVATALIAFLIEIGSGILILRWIFRANKRARAIDPKRMKVSPGWNVGWFFVPFANLWKPLQGVRETYQASAAPYAAGDPPVPPVVGWWWGAWIAYNIVGNIALRLQGAHMANALELSQVFYAVDAALGVAAGWTLIRVIRLIDEVQRRPAAAEVFS